MVAPLVIDQRYRLVRQLRKSEEVALFLVRDTRTDRLCALKVFLAPDESALRTYRNHLQLLSTLQHPHIARTVDSGTIEGRSRFSFSSREGAYLYYATEFIPGPNLQAAFPPHSIEDPELRKAFLQAVLQVCDALDYVHCRRLVHLDIKPHNILLENPPEGNKVQAKLIDFDLSQRVTTPLGTRVRGTLLLVSPEVLTNSLITEKADLYSLGATLYLVLTGTLPFTAHSQRGLIEQILSTEIPPPEKLNPAVPAGLSRLISRLMAKDPAKRPQSAQAVKEELGQVLAELNGPGDTIPASLTAPARPPIENLALVSREQQLRAVTGELEHLKQGEPLHHFLLIVGSSGTGKARFLQEVERYGSLHGVDVIRVDCSVLRSHPFEALRQFAHRLIQHCHPDHALLLRGEGALQFLKGSGEDLFAGHREHGAGLSRKRLFYQLADFFLSVIGNRQALLVWEHLEFADPAEAAFLNFFSHLLAVRSRRFGERESTAARKYDVICAGTVRSLQAHVRGDPLHTLAASPWTMTITLENFSADTVAQLLRCLRPGTSFPHDTAARIHGITGGHPLYVADVLALLSENPSGAFETQIRDLPSSVEAYFRFLLSRASPLEQRLCYALVAASRPLPLDLICEAAGEDRTATAACLEGSRLLEKGAGLVSLRWWPSLEQLPFPPERTHLELLSRLGEACAKRGYTAGAARLLALAGRPEALPLACRYAEAARRVLAWEGAQKLLEEIRSNTGQADPNLLELSASLLELAGCFPEAFQLLSHVPPRGGNTAERCLTLGLLKARSGERSEAFTFLKKAHNAAQQEKRSDLLLAVTRAVASLHLEEGEIERAEALLSETLSAQERDPKRRAPLYELLGQTACAKKNFAQALTYFQQGAKNYEKAHDLLSLGRCLIHAGTAAVKRGDFGKALGLFRHALALAHERRDPVTEAVTHHKLGITCYRRGEIHSALLHLTEAHDLWEELNERRDLADSLNNLGLVHRSAGNLGEAVTFFKQSLDILSSLGDEQGQAAVLNNLASVLDAHGRYREALTQSFRALQLRKRRQDRFGIGYSYFRIGDIYRQMGELDHALSFARKSLRLREEVSDKLGLAHTLSLLGEIHLLQGRYGESLRRLRQGLIQFQALGDRVGKLPLLLAMARLYTELGAYPSAMEVLDQSEQIAEESALRPYKAGALLGRALLKEAQEDLYGADTLLREAAGVIQGEAAPKAAAEILLHHARVLLALGNHSRGMESLERAYTLIHDMGCRDLSPLYFLLRADGESLKRTCDLNTADRLAARALSEAQELSLLPLLAWIHLTCTSLCRRRGEQQEAREHVARAEEILLQLTEDLPGRLQQSFSRSRLAQRVRAERSTLRTAHPPSEAPALPEVRHEELTAVRQRNRNLERLQEITRALNSELVLTKVLVRIIDAALEFANAERGFLIVGSEKEQRFHVARNLLGEDLPDPAHEISTSIAREVFRSGRSLVTNDAVGDVRLAKFKSVRDLKLMSIAALPLSVKDRTVGVLYLDNRSVKNAFQEDDLSLLTTLCTQAAIAIENARLIEENQRKQRQLEESNIRIAALNEQLREQLREKTEALQQAQTLLSDKFRFGNIIGKSKVMQEVFHIMERVAKTDLPVLIEGESGTGKELIANAIHFNSNRRSQPIISENCGAITSTLLESELFGHVKGAFTGAIKEKKGLFELAHKGTLFLDEVGDMDLDMQKKLLRVLEEGQIRRVGGKDVIKVAVRLITATNKNLRDLVAQGKFREDLFWRLNVIRIRVPPLRERKEDIPLLAEFFLERIAEARGGERKRLSPGALRRLLAYRWPGNVRELQHFLERAHLLARGPVIEEDEVILEAGPSESTPSEAFGLGARPFKEAREQFTRWYLARALQEHGGVVSRAARTCGISRETFHRLMRKYGLTPRNHRS